jgi:hypothetical protein
MLVKREGGENELEDSGMSDVNANHLANVAGHLGLGISGNWSGVDAVWPLLEKMRNEGAVVILKLDGERTGAKDAGPYTVLASGAPLGRSSIRVDAASIEEALIYVICRYASTVWGVPRPT